jgi:drug/metabolite transporter (DMT)-like permease
VSESKKQAPIAASLVLTVALWGGNNAGTKWLLAQWPPVFTGVNRFLFGGLLLLAILRCTKWLGEFQALNPVQYRQLWLRGGLSLAAYTAVFAWALRLTAASHVALYIGASPVWALLVEQRPQKNWSSVRRYGAALLATCGIFVLFWPALKDSKFNLVGECCGLCSSWLWANYSHQSRILARTIHGVEVAANSMWMSGVWLLPVAVIEVFGHGVVLDAPHMGVQALTIIFGGVIPYALWNSALHHWQTSRVMMFNNFIPLTTAIWAHYVLGEPLTPTFFFAMVLVVVGVAVGQMDWSKIFKLPEGF